MTAEQAVTMGDRAGRSERQDRGAVSTEMAILVGIVVAIAIAIGSYMYNSAIAHEACIPAAPGDAVPAGCSQSN